MSSTDTARAIDAAPQAAAKPRTSAAAWWILLTTALSVILCYRHISAVWREGTFFDTDDAMRLVEVRNLLKGQGWFDMTVGRLDPPHGVFMHWSRLIDAPLALLIRGFEIVMPIASAERLARILFPLLLLVLLYAGVARLARLLIGGAGLVPALLLAMLSCAAFSQFQPGHVTHSGAQIVLLVFMVAGLVEAVDPARARCAAVAGMLAAVSLAISLENFPFIALLAALILGLWVWRGAPFRRQMLAFGLALGVALPLVFLVTVGRPRWFDDVCDALSPTYLIPGMTGAVSLVVLGILSPRLSSRARRLAFALLAGAAVIAACALTQPICFLDPYHGIDPLLRKIWLAHVEEAQPLMRFLLSRPATGVILAAPVLIGLVASFGAIRQARPPQRLGWVILTAVCGAGFLLSFWQIRMIAFTCPLAVCGSAWLIVALIDHLRTTAWRKTASLSFLLVLPFSSVGWALAIPTHGEDLSRARNACLATAAFAPLANLPPGLVAGPIDAGSYILALTPHSVLAAPYHRDNHGNRIALDAFLASPPAARRILEAANVTYVIDCAGLGETAALARAAPHSLAALMVAGKTPPWLRQLSESGPLQVFVMRP